jgi:hypothetical protein
MKLYILQRRPPNVYLDYDEMKSIVVRAENSTKARAIAAINSGCEGPGIWRRSADSSCKELKPGTKVGVVIREVPGQQ